MRVMKANMSFGRTKRPVGFVPHSSQESASQPAWRRNQPLTLLMCMVDLKKSEPISIQLNLNPKTES